VSDLGGTDSLIEIGIRSVVIAPSGCSFNGANAETAPIILVRQNIFEAVMTFLAVAALYIREGSIL
jgi:hypothetical protein